MKSEYPNGMMSEALHPVAAMPKPKSKGVGCQVSGIVILSEAKNLLKQFCRK
jgi:hypothetical protein